MAARWGQLLDVQVQQVARGGVLVALDRRFRPQLAHPAQLQLAQDAADGGPAQPRLLRNPQACPALAPQHFDPGYQLR
jgi:hypothetical protein